MKSKKKFVNESSVDIFSKGILVDLTIGKWGARKKLNADDLGLNEDEVSDIFSLGQKWMVDRKMFDDINRIAREAESYLKFHSLNFPVKGIRFIPKDMIEDVSERMNEFKNDYYSLTNEFVDKNYSNSVDKIKKEYPEQWEKFNGHYPNKAELKRKYIFEYQFFQLSLPDKNAGILSEKEIMTQRNFINQQLSDFAEMYGKVLRARISKVAVNLQKRFKDGKIFKQNSINNLMELCDTFQNGLNFLDDKTVSNTVRDLKKMFNGVDAKDLRTDEVLLKEISNSLDVVVKKMEDIDDLKESVKSYGRRLVIR